MLWLVLCLLQVFPLLAHIRMQRPL
jgi:hypothetical protein